MKCVNCGTEFEIGIFCPKCGTKYVKNTTLDDQKQELEQERKELEEKRRLEQERYQLELEKKQFEKEQAEKNQQLEAEKLKLEQERIRQENERALKQQQYESELRTKQQRLETENEKIKMLTVNGIVYKDYDEARRAQEDSQKVNILLTQLRNTKSQEKRLAIFNEFHEEIITVREQQRINLIRQKVNTKQSLAYKLNFYYGISVLVGLIIFIILVAVENMVLLPFFGVWIGIGIYVWPIWKIILCVKKSKKDHYMNLKDV